MKSIRWAGNSRQAVGVFPADARRDAGYQLDRVQNGMEPSDWKPMPTIGPGVRGIRVHASGEYRVLYVAKFEEAVYVLHAFGKKTQRTSRPDIETARRRYLALVAERMNGND